MSRGIHVAKPPPRSLLVWDGDCHVCGLWIKRWRQLTGDSVEYRRSQDPRIAEQFPEIPRAEFDKSVQLIAPDGTVWPAAEAVFRSLAHNRWWQWPLWCY